MDYFLLKIAPLISSIIIVVILILGILVYYSDRKSKLNKIFIALTFFTAIWSMAVLARFLFFEDLILILFIAKVTFAASTIVALLLYYVTYFAIVKNTYRPPLILLSSLAATLFLLSLFSPYVVAKIEIVNGTQQATYGFAYYIFSGYFLGLIIFDTYNLIVKKRILGLSQRKQINFFLVGLVMSASLALSTNVFIPFFTGIAKISMLGPSMVIFFITATFYAIFKHHLFNIKVIATELFSALLFLTLIIRFLLSESLNQFIINGIIVLGFAIFGILLIRSVWKEVEAREEIQKLADRLSDFVSFVTHELRTPVTKFKGALSNILSKTYGEISNRSLEDILLKLQVVAQEMGQSIETFLAMNKIEIKKLELTLKPADLNELFGAEINELQPQAKQKNIWLKLRPLENLPLVSADEFQIKHVLDNLVSNAVKYTPQNGHISVYFEVLPKSREVITIVEDNGIGIEKETMPALFSKYERGESSSRKFAEGTGLGLFLAKQIIEMHNGRIWAESEGKDKGSRFKFSLPISNSRELEKGV